MTGFSGRWLVTVSLAGFLVTPLFAHAQSGRAWVDPPAESDALPSRPVHTPSPAPMAAPAKPAEPVSTPQHAAKPAPQSDTINADAELQRPPDATQQSAAVDEQAKPKPLVERKTRASQQANSSTRTKRNAQIERRREARTQMSQAEPRNAFERRARITRYGSIQEGLDAGLQVMRLRTIQLPDGRHITVLTRPDQDIASGMIDGY
ncbi:hypothetical protein [Microvirga zambiensis]|uniref:hypothetical protein n=1 Tax=Microvirga zambiensis TaxID=1402137 RepID=UPI00191DF2E5|nr:hypothetical protein [Microvirga zambiensis]